MGKSAAPLTASPEIADFRVGPDVGLFVGGATLERGPPPASAIVQFSDPIFVKKPSTTRDGDVGKRASGTQ